jgi:hypothetical protein
MTKNSSKLKTMNTIKKFGLLGNTEGAEFSECMRYRYKLWRIWDPNLGVCNFLMLNPSTADEMMLDPTVSRCMKYARANGYGALVVTNLFAFRATDPRELKNTESPVGEFNNEIILDVAKDSKIVVCGWGVHGGHQQRSAQVLSIIATTGRKPYALAMTKGGEPGHPLYLRGDAIAKPFGKKSTYR